MPDFFPGSEAARKSWFATYKEQIAVKGPAVGVTGAEITAQQEVCQQCVDAYTAVEETEAAYKGAVDQKKLLVSNVLVNTLRPDINRIKTHAGYTPEIGNALGIVASGGGGNPEEYVAKISAEVTGGFIRIKFVKGIAEGVNIYHRLKGSGDWQFLARDTKSPYDDHITIPPGGAPQHWEYQAYGVFDDQQLGTPSAIAEATIG